MLLLLQFIFYSRRAVPCTIEPNDIWILYYCNLLQMTLHKCPRLFCVLIVHGSLFKFTSFYLIIIKFLWSKKKHTQERNQYLLTATEFFINFNQIQKKKQQKKLRRRKWWLTYTHTAGPYIHWCVCVISIWCPILDYSFQNDSSNNDKIVTVKVFSCNFL